MPRNKAEDGKVTVLQTQLAEAQQRLKDREDKFAEREAEFVDRLDKREAQFAEREAAFEERLAALQAKDD